MEKINKMNQNHKKMNLDRFEFMTDEEILEAARPKNVREKELLRIISANLKPLATIKQVASFLNVSESFIYKALEKRAILAYKVGSKTEILTETLTNIVCSLDLLLF